MTSVRADRVAELGIGLQGDKLPGSYGALAAVLPLLPAKQRALPPGDWLEQDTEVCCPDPDERLIMRVERTGVSRLRTTDLT